MGLLSTLLLLLIVFLLVFIIASNFINFNDADTLLYSTELPRNPQDALAYCQSHAIDPNCRVLCQTLAEKFPRVACATYCALPSQSARLAQTCVNRPDFADIAANREKIVQSADWSSILQDEMSV